MPLMREIRRRARLVVGPLLFACVAGYFGYHTMNGDRSAVALIRLDQQILEAKDLLARTTETREVLERRASLLRPDNLDRDMLDEQIRLMLNYGRPNDVVVMSAPAQRGGADKAVVLQRSPAITSN